MCYMILLWTSDMYLLCTPKGLHHVTDVGAHNLWIVYLFSIGRGAMKGSGLWGGLWKICTLSGGWKIELPRNVLFILISLNSPHPSSNIKYQSLCVGSFLHMIIYSLMNCVNCLLKYLHGLSLLNPYSQNWIIICCGQCLEFWFQALISVLVSCVHCWQQFFVLFLEVLPKKEV